MSVTSVGPDISQLEIPMDQWTLPFWEATARGALLLPRCTACRRFRWPPGPFCPGCQSQQIDWEPPGTAYLYSFTIIEQASVDSVQPATLRIPALVEFPAANNVRLLAAIVNARVDDLHIGAPLTLGWSTAANATVPLFKIA